MTVEITDASFKTEVTDSPVPVLVDFWAPWCGPCKMIAPVLEEIAQEYEGKAKIVKINIDDNQNTPAQFGVRSIPTLILFKNGQEVEKIIGAQGKDKLTALIDSAL
jgi:thioredoxin 1